MRWKDMSTPEIINLFSTMAPLSNCPLFYAPLTINKSHKQTGLRSRSRKESELGAFWVESESDS